MRSAIKTRQLATWAFGSLLLAALSFTGCSGSQQDDEQLDNKEANNKSDLGNDDAHDANGTKADDANAKSSKNSADVNSATASDTAPATDAPATLNNSASPMATDATPAPANAASANNSKAAAPAPAAAPAGGGAPVAGGRVRYVKSGGVQVMNAPNGSAVMTLDQGEHPVTWEENGWLRISNGMYVPVDALSSKGVPRTTAGHSWAH